MNLEKYNLKEDTTVTSNVAPLPGSLGASVDNNPSGTNKKLRLGFKSYIQKNIERRKVQLK